MLNFFKNADWNTLIPVIIDKIIGTILIIVIGYFLVRFVNNLLVKLLKKPRIDTTLKTFIESLVYWGMWIVILLILMSYIGVDIGPILASLSVAGFITGFAMKDVLSNLAAGMMILGNKPFKVGDYIKSGGISGTVKKIGISSSVLTTPENQKITVPNAELWGNPITNYSAYKTRRIDIKIGVSYEEDIDMVIRTLDEIVKEKKEILKEPEVSFFVSELGDYTVNIGLRCWTKIDDYWDILYFLNKKIKEVFEKKKISMPNPTMDINMRKE
ncbi:mechanosensitive ion channel [Candidatus Woesearchaeota archaeon]|nr:mechanosensitive ion channel [Candidatus Woesearchaeota archaeon]